MDNTYTWFHNSPERRRFINVKTNNMYSIEKLITIVEKEFPDIKEKDTYNNYLFDWILIKNGLRDMYKSEIEKAYSDGLVAMKNSIIDDTHYDEPSNYFTKNKY